MNRRLYVVYSMKNPSVAYSWHVRATSGLNACSIVVKDQLLCAEEADDLDAYAVEDILEEEQD